jgi:hypothetical protein
MPDRVLKHASRMHRHPPNAISPRFNLDWRFLSDEEEMEPSVVPSISGSTKDSMRSEALEALVQMRMERILQEGSDELDAITMGTDLDGGTAAGGTAAGGTTISSWDLTSRGLTSKKSTTDKTVSSSSSSLYIPQNFVSSASGLGKFSKEKEMGPVLDELEHVPEDEDVEDAGDGSGRKKGPQFKLKPPPPMVIWRPPTHVKLATDVPNELKEVKVSDKQYSTLAVKLRHKREEAAANAVAAGIDVAAESEEVDEIRRPTKPKPTKRSPRAKATKAKHPPEQQLAPKGPPRYGAWYIPPDKWKVGMESIFEDMQKRKDGYYGMEMEALKQREQRFQQELPSLYITKQFKNYMRDNNLRTPGYLARIDEPDQRRRGRPRPPPS